MVSRRDDQKSRGPIAGRVFRFSVKFSLALAVGLIILESGLQILFYPGFAFNRFIEPDQYMWGRFRPGVEGDNPIRGKADLKGWSVRYHHRVKINSQGFRSSREFARSPEPGVFRIICLGDSITFGWGVEEEYTWPVLLEGALGRRFPGLGFEVINAGYPGHTTRQGLIWLDRELKEMRPGLMIVQFGFNDALPCWHRSLGPVRFKSDNELMRGLPGAWYPVNRGGIHRLSSLLYNTFITKFSLAALTMFTAGDEGKERDSMERTFHFSRVPPDDYRENLVLTSRLCGQNNIRVILIDSWGTPGKYRSITKQVGADTGAPVVSQAKVIEKAAQEPGPVLADERFRPIFEMIKQRSEIMPTHPFPHVLVDFLHPNEVGNILFVEKLIEVISEKD
jgi:lysophospholipase L1-like esterase